MIECSSQPYMLGITIDGNYLFKETASAGFRKIPPNIKD
jgi:hypothetical protein